MAGLAGACGGDQGGRGSAVGDLYAFSVLERNKEDFTRNRFGLIRTDGSGRVVDSLPFLVWHEEAPPVVAQSADGGMSTAYGIPFQASNLTQLLPSGGLVSGFGDEYVFFLMHPDGRKPVRIEREHTPVPVTATEAADHRARIEFSMRRVDPAWSWSGRDLPSTKSAYRAIAVGSDGSRRASRSSMTSSRRRGACSAAWPCRPGHASSRWMARTRGACVATRLTSTMPCGSGSNPH